MGRNHGFNLTHDANIDSICHLDLLMMAVQIHALPAHLGLRESFDPFVYNNGIVAGS